MSRPVRTAIGLAVVAILAATLLPTSQREGAGWLSCWICGERGVADVILNVILFMPFGAGLALGGMHPGRIWLFGVLFSAGIEYAQLYVPGRNSSVADVISNSSGALVGCALALALGRLVRQGRRPSPLQAAAASALAVGVVAGTGLLLQPAFPTSPYFCQWTPDLGQFAWYRGHVLEASLDDAPLPSRRLTDSPRIRQLLSVGATLRVRALAGPPVTALAPLLSIFDDRQREILLLGPYRAKLVFRYRTRAAAWRLDRPDLRVDGALRGVSPGDTLDIAVRRTGRSYCLTLNDALQTCNLGFTAGTGWALLVHPSSLPPWLETALSIGWMAGLLLPAGFWSASRGGLAIGIGTVVAGLAFVAPATGLLATPAFEWAGAAFGFTVGAGSQEVLIRLRQRAQPSWTPDPSVRTSSCKQRSILLKVSSNTSRG